MSLITDSRLPAKAASETWRSSPAIDLRMGVIVELSEINTHSFIVKLWLEETNEETGRITWRGHITHVASGDRRYLKNLDEIAEFIAPYLESMGVRMGIRQRVKQWLNRQKISL